MYRVSRLKYWRTKNKYNARKTTCLTDHWHNSGLEAKVCNELRLRKIAGELDYEVEKTFQLNLEGVRLGSYRADFVVTYPEGAVEIVEAKGMMLPSFRTKWAIMQKMYPHYAFRIVRK